MNNTKTSTYIWNIDGGKCFQSSYDRVGWNWSECALNVQLALQRDGTTSATFNMDNLDAILLSHMSAENRGNWRILSSLLDNNSCEMPLSYINIQFLFSFRFASFFKGIRIYFELLVRNYKISNSIESPFRNCCTRGVCNVTIRVAKVTHSYIGVSI